jgi:hypothetical protein
MRLTELSPFAGRTCLWFMVFNATFNNIADIVAEETGLPGENHRHSGRTRKLILILSCF